jgi:hypothetical protein
MIVVPEIVEKGRPDVIGGRGHVSAFIACLCNPACWQAFAGQWNSPPSKPPILAGGSESVQIMRRTVFVLSRQGRRFQQP